MQAEPLPAEEELYEDVDRTPSCPEAEEMLLGTILHEPTTIDQAMARIDDTKIFYDTRNRIIYATILKLKKEKRPINTVSVVLQLRDNGRLAKVGGYPRISELPDKIPCCTLADFWIDIMFEKFRDRKIVELCDKTSTDLKDLGEHTSEWLIEEFQKKARTLPATQTLLPRSIQDDVQDLIAFVESRIADDKPTLGLSTGFADIDERTSGMAPGEFWVIGARPSVGKSTLMANMFSSLTVGQGVPAAFYSYEMNTRALLNIMASSHAQVNAKRAYNGRLDDAEMKSYSNALLKLNKAPAHIYEAGRMSSGAKGFSVDQLCAHAHQVKESCGIEAIFVDYLQLVRCPARSENRQQEVAEVSMSLKAVATSLGVPVISAAQVGRDVERTRRAPRLSDLRESGQIEADADLIAFLHSSGSHNGVDVIIAKQRTGPVGTITLQFDANMTRFSDTPKIHDDDVPPQEGLPYRD